MAPPAGGHKTKNPPWLRRVRKEHFLFISFANSAGAPLRLQSDANARRHPGRSSAQPTAWALRNSKSLWAHHASIVRACQMWSWVVAAGWQTAAKLIRFSNGGSTESPPRRADLARIQTRSIQSGGGLRAIEHLPGKRAGPGRAVRK